MALHLAARFHAFINGLFKQSDAREAQLFTLEVERQFAEAGLETDEDRDLLITTIASDAANWLDVSDDHPQQSVIWELTNRLFDYEDLFRLPVVDWTQKHTIAECWNIRDAFAAQQLLVTDFDATKATLTETVFGILHPLYNACPALIDDIDETDGIVIETALLESVGDLAGVTETIFRTAFSDEIVEQDIFKRLRERLECNLIAASGGNPADPQNFRRAPKWPEQFDAKTRTHLIETYLGGTPLADLFNQTLPFILRTNARFEHHHIVAGSGHGKTQTLQFLIAKDLEAVAAGRRSVVVLDSQGDLIRNISQLAIFAPGAPLHDKIVIIDPSDVEWPVSLNLFDVGQERLKRYPALERERLTNSILELYDFVLGTLLDAQMTQKQNVIFRYVTRLILQIPDATIHTLRQLMEPGAETAFAEHIAKLEGTARHFFETEFASREFEQTKRQVLRRLWGILENQTFERMFSHPRSKLDLFSEMNAGKVILINTAKDLLKEQGTEIFGRFFIALIAQAAQERATLSERERTPTFVYVDEAADYFDRNIAIILAQARKYRVGMVLAHQYLGQLEPKLQEAFSANTAIKFAGGVSAKDARVLAPMLYCDPAFIEAQPKGSFAAHIRGVTKSAVPLSFPFGHLEAQPMMSNAEREALQSDMREHYAVHYSKLGHTQKRDGEADGAGSDDDTPEPEDELGHIDTEAGKSW